PRQTCRRGCTQDLPLLPRARQRSRLCLHAFRTLNVRGGAARDVSNIPLVLGHCPWRNRMSEMPDFDRRRFFGAAATTVAAASLGLLTFSRRLEAMTQTPTAVAEQTGKDQGELRPFKVNVPEAQITDLRMRVKATKWPEKETVPDATQGVQLA